ncbi:MAG: putative PurR-regulated permease PerM [Bradymonadia bacterium]|jgi:predicted PurR-regulated permease PerM
MSELSNEASNKPRFRWLFPLAVTAFFVGFAVKFPDLALLLFIAVLIVYLIEPVVARIASFSYHGRAVPRWTAVLLVYTTMLGATIGGVAVFAPMLSEEAATLATEVPQFVRKTRTEVLPRISARINQLQALFAPTASAENPIAEAGDIVRNAAEAAELESLLVSMLSAEERALYSSGSVVIESEAPGEDSQPVLFTISTLEDGTLAVHAGDEDLLVRATDEGEYLITASSRAGPGVVHGGLDLEQAFADSLNSAVETSGKEVADVLQLSQRLLGKLIAAIVGIFVTFMVAAFISIDVPRIVRAIEEFIPGVEHDSTERLLARLNRGLSGVIRGQIAICVINAILTGLGLLLLDVKFALLLAILAGFGSLVPIFGTIVSSIPALFIALTQSVATAVLLVFWILGIHFIEANILQPKIMGSAAKIHPAIIILALLAGEHTYGVIGALVAVPMASVLQSLLLFAREQHSRAVTPIVPEDDHSAGSEEPIETPSDEGKAE